MCVEVTSSADLRGGPRPVPVRVAFDVRVYDVFTLSVGEARVPGCSTSDSGDVSRWSVVSPAGLHSRKRL